MVSAPLTSSNIGSGDYPALTKLCCICLVDTAGVYDDDVAQDALDSSLDDFTSQELKGSDNASLSMPGRTALIPDANKRLKQRQVFI